jgi:molybdopterin biosynthesis enzyme
MMQANGLMVIPENVFEINPGDKVKVELLEPVTG